MSARQRLYSLLAVVLAATALAAPEAGARPASEPSGNRQLNPTVNRQLGPTVSRTVVDQGFDVGSAALGAGGATGLLLLTAGGSAALWQRRHQLAR